MERFWKNLDLTQASAKIKSLEDLLTCKKCDQMFPEDEECYLVTTCRHQLCKKCYDPQSWSGSCPICGRESNRKDVKVDRSRIELVRGLNTLKRKFGIHSIQLKKDIVSEKESTKEKSIIFDDQTDQMDIDLDDSQVDLSNFDDIVRIKEPGANKEIRDSMTKKVNVVDEPHKSTDIQKFRFQSRRNSFLEDSNVESEVVKRSKGARNKPTTSTTDVSIFSLFQYSVGPSEPIHRSIGPPNVPRPCYLLTLKSVISMQKFLLFLRISHVHALLGPTRLSILGGNSHLHGY